MSRWIARTAAEVAQFFGVSAQTVAGWRKDGMPGTARKYDLAEVYKWKLERDEKREKLYASRRKAAVLADPDHAWKMARARLLQLRCEREELQVMAVEAHDDFVVRLCATFRNGLFALAATLSAQLEGLDEHARLEVVEARFTDLLSAFSNGDPGPTASGAEGEVPGSAEAAQEGEPQRVGRRKAHP